MSADYLIIFLTFMKMNTIYNLIYKIIYKLTESLYNLFVFGFFKSPVIFNLNPTLADILTVVY